MADNVTRRGFRWAYSKNGGEMPVRVVHVATGYATLLARGDAVKFAADGLQRAAAGDALICGIVLGVKQYWDGTYRKRGRFLPASTSYGTDLTKQSLVQIIPVSGQVFEVDADDSSTATTEAAYKALINENCDHIIESGSLNISYMALDISDHKTATAQWRIVDVAKTFENVDFSGNRVKLHVECNESEEPAFSTSVSA